jgi:hypothetical protein
MEEKPGILVLFSDRTTRRATDEEILARPCVVAALKAAELEVEQDWARSLFPIRAALGMEVLDASANIPQRITEALKAEYLRGSTASTEATRSILRASTALHDLEKARLVERLHWWRDKDLPYKAPEQVGYAYVEALIANLLGLLTPPPKAPAEPAPVPAKD